MKTCPVLWSCSINWVAPSVVPRTGPADTCLPVIRAPCYAHRAHPFSTFKIPKGIAGAQQRALLDHLRMMNEDHLSTRYDNTNLAARVASYELAYKMQSSAPEAVDIDKEPAHIKELYGVDGSRTDDFGRKCLLARRMVERGVRFIQVYSGGHHNDANWDAHGDLVKNHELHAGNTDKPIAGLLKDLKQRGLLDETLVVWGGEFGRQPTAEYQEGTGRDHNSYGFTMWMAGGGIKGEYLLVLPMNWAAGPWMINSMFAACTPPF